MKKGRAKAADAETEMMDEETRAAMAAPDEDEAVEDEANNIDKDPMIKAKKPRVAAGAAKSRGGAAAAGKKGESSRGGHGASAAGAGSRRGKK